MWATDITYIPSGLRLSLFGGDHGLGARAVLSWRLSNTMDVSFCLSKRLKRLWGVSARRKSSTAIRARSSLGRLHRDAWRAGIQISMDGRGRCMDNIFIERLWRSLKHEEIYLKRYADGREARAGIQKWIAFYNDRRPHRRWATKRQCVVWREDMACAKAVDMVDNASPPRCPHAHSRNSRRSLSPRDRKE